MFTLEPVENLSTSVNLLILTTKSNDSNSSLISNLFVAGPTIATELTKLLKTFFVGYENEATLRKFKDV